MSSLEAQADRVTGFARGGRDGVALRLRVGRPSVPTRAPRAASLGGAQAQAAPRSVTMALALPEGGDQLRVPLSFP